MIDLKRYGSIWDRNERINQNDNLDTIERIINNRGVEILSDSAFLTWLDENGIKHREEVQSISNLPAHDSLNTVRGVADDNKIYIKKENGWVPFQTIDISKINLVENKIDNLILSPLFYGAVGDGVADDTQAFRDAINALPSGGNLHLAAGYIFAIESTTINKDLVITGTGTVKWIDGFSSGDQLLRFNGRVLAEDFTADGNAVNKSTSYDGDGHVLVNNSDNSVFNKVLAKNSVNNTFRNISGNVSFLNCKSENAGYAGFNNYGSGDILLRDCIAENYKFKGYSDNSNAKKIVLDNFKAPTNSNELGVDSILVDPNGRRVGKIIISGFNISSSNRSNCIKAIDFDTLIVENCNLESKNTLYALHTYVTNPDTSENNMVIIRNTKGIGRVDLKNTDTIIIDSLTVDALEHTGQVTTIINPLGVQARKVNIKNLSILGGSSHGLYIDMGLGKMEKMIVDSYEYTSNNGSNAFSFAYATSESAQQKPITVKNLKLNTSGIIGSTGVRARIIYEDVESLFVDNTGKRYIQKVIDGQMTLEQI